MGPCWSWEVLPYIAFREGQEVLKRVIEECYATLHSDYALLH